MFESKTLLEEKNYKLNASVGVKELCKTVSAVLNTGAEHSLIKEDCVPQVWKKNVVKLMTTRLQSAADTHLDLKGVTWLQVQLGQRVARVSFLVVVKLATDAILGTPYINDNIDRIYPRKEKLILSGSIPVAKTGKECAVT